MAEQKPRATRTRKKATEAGLVAGTAAGPQGVTRAKPAKKTAAKAPRRREAPRVTARPDEIAVRAYLLWEQGEPGDATDHWLAAERELAAA